jgi:hypothetical protein
VNAREDYLILDGEEVIGFLPSCTAERLEHWLSEHYGDDPAKYRLTVKRTTDAPDVSFDFIGEEPDSEPEASWGDREHQREMEEA